jgi:hypothetical protein
MKHTIVVAIASILALTCLSAGTASAQAPPIRPGIAPYNRPQPLLSPYLDLLRGGDPAANYYLGVVPERERRRNDVIFRGAILDLEQRTQQLAEGEDVFTPLRSTGHMTAFGYTGTYFGTTRTQTQAPATRPPTTPATRPPMR